jgi:hypothetical protein
MCVICARRTTVGRGARGGVPTRASHDRHMTGVAGARRRLLWVWGAGCWGCKAPAIVGVGRRLLGVQGAGCWGCRDMMCHVCVRVTAGGKWPPVTPVSELCCPPLSAVAAAATVAAVSCSRCRHRCCRCYVTAVTTAALPPLPLLHHCRCRCHPPLCRGAGGHTDQRGRTKPPVHSVPGVRLVASSLGGSATRPDRHWYSCHMVASSVHVRLVERVTAPLPTVTTTLPAPAPVSTCQSQHAVHGMARSVDWTKMHFDHVECVPSLRCC